MEKACYEMTDDIAFGLVIVPLVLPLGTVLDDNKILGIMPKNPQIIN